GEPPEVAAVAVAAQDTDSGGRVWVPAPHWPPLPGTLLARDVASQRQQDVVLGDRHVVDHIEPRNIYPNLALQNAIRGESPDMDIRRVVAAGLISEGDHFPGLAVDLGMRGERPALDRAARIVETARVERDGIDFVGEAVLLQREQPS